MAKEIWKHFYCSVTSYGDVQTQQPIKRIENEIILFLAYSSLGRIKPEDGPNSRAKPFRALDKISYKSGLHFIPRPSKCFVFLIFVMASGPVDCYGNASMKAPNFCSMLSIANINCSKIMRSPLKKKTFSLYLLPGFWVSAVHILIFALQKGQSSKLAQNLLKTLKTESKTKLGKGEWTSGIKETFAGLREKWQMLQFGLVSHFFQENPRFLS